MKIGHWKLSRRRFLGVSLAGTAAVTGLYAWRIEPHWLQVTFRDLPIPGLPSQLVGSTLVHLSDLHIGSLVSSDYLRSVFQRITDLAPEFIAYTGDFVCRSGELNGDTKSLMAALPLGRRATLGVLGNHDYGLRWSDSQRADRIALLAEQRGVSILRNEITIIDGLQVLGFDDPWGRRFELDRTMDLFDESLPSIALTHNPDTVDETGWEPFEGWILAGHTHGGQVKPPFLAPPRLPVRNKRYTSGVFELSGNRRMYISRGVGYKLRVRLNVRPEATVFRLKAG